MNTDTTGHAFELASIPHGATLSIFTDGAAIDNPGPAGAAFVIVMADAEVFSRAFPLGHATNNVAELTGPIEALRFLGERTDLKITISTDAKYVSNGFTQWLPNWKRNGWRSSTGGAVKNRELWEALDTEAAKFPDLRWAWIKGHAGHRFNEQADELATRAAKASALEGITNA